MNCSSLIDPYDKLVSEVVNLSVSGHRRFNLLYKHFNKNTAVTLSCHRCGSVQPSFKYKQTPYYISCHYKEPTDEISAAAATTTEDAMKPYYADVILPILKRLNDRDMTLLGFHPQYSRPEWMIWTKMVVPPPSVRPSIKFGTGNRGEDDLTIQLCTIINWNKELHKLIKSPNINLGSINATTNLLQWHITAFIDNKQTNINTVTQRTGRPLKTLFERIRGKAGRIRTNLLGKRVDHSARTVASSDPYISIDEIGIPYKIAMNLTFPETVNRYNHARLLKSVQNGNSKYPGAKYIKKKNGVPFAIHENFDTIDVEEGDIVFRHLIDGDPVIVNRQPTLHRMSMMTHKVRVLKYNTFRISVNVTKSYAGDFDGDEFNIHVPQSVQTAMEILLLSSPHTQIISPRDSKPIISILQDMPIGLYIMTDEKTTVSTKSLCNYICNLNHFRISDAVKLSNQYTREVAGKKLFEFLLPKNINAKVGGVTIKDGQLISGRVDSSTYGKKSNGLVHTTLSEYNNIVAKDLVDNTQKLILNWMLDNGFSVGLKDLLVSPDMRESLVSAKKLLKERTDKVLENVHLNKLNNTSGVSNEAYLEVLMSEAMTIDDKEILSKLEGGEHGEENRFMQLITSGSKGKVSNLFHMVGLVGPQMVGGMRVQEQFDGRTLPHFTKFNDGPAARGFVENSYIHGLEPHEFFFHAIKGREGWKLDTTV